MEKLIYTATVRTVWSRQNMHEYVTGDIFFQIFHPTESKYPQSVAQASWGEKSPKMTKLIYQHREKELKHIVVRKKTINFIYSL